VGRPPVFFQFFGLPDRSTELRDHCVLLAPLDRGDAVGLLLWQII